MGSIETTEFIQHFYSMFYWVFCMLINWGAHPFSVLIISFSCSFRHKLCEIIGWCHHPGIWCSTLTKTDWWFQDSWGCTNLLFGNILAKSVWKWKKVDWEGAWSPSTSLVCWCLRSQPFNTMSSSQNVSGVNQYPTAEVVSWLLKRHHERPISDLSIFASEDISRLEGWGSLK